jgi:hypothetical protein
MTKPAFRRVVVFVGTAALAAGSGAGVAAQADEANRATAPHVVSGETVAPAADAPAQDAARAEAEQS